MNEIGKPILSIYPNPVNGTLTIGLPSEKNNISVRIYDNAGRIVFTKNQLSGMMVRMDLNLASGVYSAEIIADGEQWIQKILVEGK